MSEEKLMAFAAGMHSPDFGSCWQEGMTLRDYIAIKAMQGLMGRSWDVENKGDEAVMKQWAESAYIVADLMLEARKK